MEYTMWMLLVATQEAPARTRATFQASITYCNSC